MKSLRAADGQAALEKFSSYEVALVLLDIQMPKLNGLEVPAEIRKTSQVPVLMLTAFQDEEYKMSAVASLDGYLEKPSPLPLKSEGGRDFQALLRYGTNLPYKDTKVDFESYSASLRRSRSGC